MAVLRRPRAGGPAASLQARASVSIAKLSAGREGGAPGFRSDLPPLTRMLWTGLPAAACAFPSAPYLALHSPGALKALQMDAVALLFLGSLLLRLLFLSHP